MAKNRDEARHNDRPELGDKLLWMGRIGTIVHIDEVDGAFWARFVKLYRPYYFGIEEWRENGELNDAPVVAWDDKQMQSLKNTESVVGHLKDSLETALGFTRRVIMDEMPDFDTETEREFAMQLRGKWSGAISEAFRGLRGIIDVAQMLQSLQELPEEGRKSPEEE